MLKGDFQIDNEWMLKRNLKSFEYIKISSKGGKIFVVVQALSRVQLFATPWNIARQASLSFTISPSLLKFMSIESVMPSNNIILCPLLLLLPSVLPSIGDAIQPSHPLLSPSPASNFSQHQGLFKWVSSSHQVAKVLEFQLQQSFQKIFRTDFL